MYREKLIKSLGTPEAKQYITEILAPAILLSHVHEDACWRVVDARDVELKEFEFEDLNELIIDFDGDILAKDDNFCLLTKSDDEAKKMMLKKYWDQTTTLEELSRDKSTLTKFTYQLLSLEKLIPSLLEPFPVEILLNILIDSLGEIFTSCAASYSNLGNGKIRKVGSVGCYQFPEELDQFERCYAGSVIKEGPYLVSSISENECQYFLLFKRDTPFQDEEVSILKTLASLLQKSRFLLNKQGEQHEIETLLSQFEFILEALKDFSTTILSSFDENELQKNACDAIKEMFQAEYVSIYDRISDTQNFRLLQFVDLKKRDFEKFITVSADVETGKMTVEVPFHYQKCYGVKTDSHREVLIFIGESVLENYYKKEIIQTLDKIIPTEINRAFSNIDAINKVKEQSDYIKNIAQNMWYVSENLQEIEKVGNKEKLLEKINDLSEYSNTTRFKELKLYEKYEHENEQTMIIGQDDSVFGSVVFEKNNLSNMKNDYMLSFLSQIALQTNEKINVFRPDESVTKFENIMVDFLKVKYRLAGFNGEPSIFQLDGNSVVSEKLDGYGVGISVGDVVFFASYLSGSDLNRLFE